MPNISKKHSDKVKLKLDKRNNIFSSKNIAINALVKRLHFNLNVDYIFIYYRYAALVNYVHV